MKYPETAQSPTEQDLIDLHAEILNHEDFDMDSTDEPVVNVSKS